MADEQPQPELVLAEAEPSWAEPSPHGGGVPDFYHVLTHSLRFPAFLVRRDTAAAPYAHVMERIVRDGVATWYVDGEPVASGGGYRNGGFGGVPASDEAIAALPAETAAGHGEGEARGGRMLRGVPGSLRGRRHAQDDALRARLPRGLHHQVARDQPSLPALPL